MFYSMDGMGSKKFSIKEGFLEKRSTFMKIPVWRQRYFVLNSEVLCYFKKEEQSQRGLTPIGRIFLLDINVGSMLECEYKKRKHCLTIEDDESTFWLSFECEGQRKEWATAIKTAKENDRKKEETDPIRKRSMKLKGGIKRVTVNRSTDKGVGCTIKNIGGIILINRILEDGPVAGTGILRPGDQVMEVNGVAVSNKSIHEISAIIKSGPENTIFTVKPVTDFRYCNGQSTKSTAYAELDHEAMVHLENTTEKARSHDDLTYKSSYNRSLSVPAPDIKARQCVTPPPPRRDLNYVELDYSKLRAQNMLPEIQDYARSNSLPCNTLHRGEQTQRPSPQYIDIDLNAFRGRNQSDVSSMVAPKKSPRIDRKAHYVNIRPGIVKPIPAPRTGVKGRRHQNLEANRHEIPQTDQDDQTEDQTNQSEQTEESNNNEQEQES